MYYRKIVLKTTLSPNEVGDIIADNLPNIWARTFDSQFCGTIKQNHFKLYHSRYHSGAGQRFLYPVMLGKFEQKNLDTIIGVSIRMNVVGGFLVGFLSLLGVLCFILFLIKSDIKFLKMTMMVGCCALILFVGFVSDCRAMLSDIQRLLYAKPIKKES